MIKPTAINIFIVFLYFFITKRIYFDSKANLSLKANMNLSIFEYINFCYENKLNVG